MSKIKAPSQEMLDYIKGNYTYNLDGTIDGPQKRNVGSIHKKIILYIRLDVYFNGKRKHIMRSHIVWFLNKGYWPTFELDHKDRDPFNDKIENLREVTIYEQQNNKKNVNTYKGFSIILCSDKKRNKPWRVRNQSRMITLGYFESKLDAQIEIDRFINEKGKWWV